MPSPQWNGSPSRYQPNPADDRAVADDPAAAAAYFQLAVAIAAITDDFPPELFRAMAPGTRRGVRTAEAALRRSAFSVVLYAGRDD